MADRKAEKDCYIFLLLAEFSARKSFLLLIYDSSLVFLSSYVALAEPEYSRLFLLNSA